MKFTSTLQGTDHCLPTDEATATPVDVYGGVPAALLPMYAWGCKQSIGLCNG